MAEQSAKQKSVNECVVIIRPTKTGKLILEEVNDKSSGTMYCNIPDPERGINDIKHIVNDVMKFIKDNNGKTVVDGKEVSITFEPWIHPNNKGRTDLVARVSKNRAHGELAKPYLQLADPNVTLTNASSNIDKNKGLTL